jgi:DNA-binding CsgD family transcriptional regulator
VRLISIIVFSLFASLANAQSLNDSLLQQLDYEISKRDDYEKKKIQYLESLKAMATVERGVAKFRLLSAIYDQYITYKYDSAFLYARRMQQVAEKIGDRRLVNSAKIKTSFVLLSSGLFTEALDTLKTIKTSALDDSLKVHYYNVIARACVDLADFTRDNFYGKQYAERANAYLDSALQYVDEDDIDFYLLKGLKSLHLRDMQTSRTLFETVLHKFQLTDRQYAVVASTLSFIYFYSDEETRSKEMLIRAAIADIRTCTKETIATTKLAEMLFNEGDIENAYRYIKIASDDAEFYGARQRKVQVATIYPLIEAKQLNTVESKRKSLLIYSSLITALTVSVIGFLVVISKQNKKLQKARKDISVANASLTETNHQLQDANKIKEEYIWYYFNTTADYIGRFDALKKTLELKVATKKLDDIKFTVESINIKRERDELYHNFDKTFLKLFPDFVTVFNTMFNEEDRIQLKEGQLMNTELRIFALIRMGLHDHEKIAKILDYSVTTIYTYKTRVRSKAIISGEEFDRRIMGIRAI